MKHCRRGTMNISLRHHFLWPICERQIHTYLVAGIRTLAQQTQDITEWPKINTSGLSKSSPAVFGCFSTWLVYFLRSVSPVSHSRLEFDSATWGQREDKSDELRTPFRWSHRCHQCNSNSCGGGGGGGVLVFIVVVVLLTVVVVVVNFDV